MDPGCCLAGLAYKQASTPHNNSYTASCSHRLNADSERLKTENDLEGGGGRGCGQRRLELTAHLHVLKNQHGLAFPWACAVELHNASIKTKRLQNLNFLRVILTSAHTAHDEQRAMYMCRQQASASKTCASFTCKALCAPVEMS